MLSHDVDLLYLSRDQVWGRSRQPVSHCSMSRTGAWESRHEAEREGLAGGTSGVTSCTIEGERERGKGVALKS